MRSTNTPVLIPSFTSAVKLMAAASFFCAVAVGGAVSADMKVMKTANATAVAGTNLTYVITVTNNGPDTAFIAVMDDTTPVGTKFVSMNTPIGWTCTTPTAGGTGAIHCSIANFFNLASVTFNLVVSINLTGVTTLANTATVSSLSFDLDTTNNSDTARTNVTGLADLTVSKSHAGNFFQGQLGAIYNVVVTNAGNISTSGTSTLVDTLPAGLTATAIAGAGWTCTLATLTCTSAAVVAAGASFPAITVTVNVAPNAPATLTNLVTVSGGGEVNTTNNTASDPAMINPLDFFQVRYAANLTAGDSVINITNTGANGAPLNGPGFGNAAGNICVNVYAFSPDEQLISCCSCLVTPNGLVALSVNSDLVSNTLTGVRPNSVVVKLVNTGASAAFNGTTCTNSAAMAGAAAFPLAGGLLAFGTTLHAGAAAGSFPVTETPFLKATLSPGELASITNRCTNIVGNGSSFGICRSCRAGGLSSTK